MAPPATSRPPDDAAHLTCCYCSSSSSSSHHHCKKRSLLASCKSPRARRKRRTAPFDSSYRCHNAGILDAWYFLVFTMLLAWMMKTTPSGFRGGPHGMIAAALRLQENYTCQIITLIPFTDLRPGPGIDPSADLRNTSNSTTHTTDSSVLPKNNDNTNDTITSWYGYGEWPDAQALAEASFSLLAAAEMARQHFNARSRILVPELAQLTRKCPIRFPSIPWYVNSAYDRQESLSQVLLLAQQQQQHELVSQNDSDSGVLPSFCALLGPTDGPSQQALAGVAEAWNIPLVTWTPAYPSGAIKPVDPYRNWATVGSNLNTTAAVLADFYGRAVWQRTKVAILYDDSDFGQTFSSSLLQAQQGLGYDALPVSFRQGDIQSMLQALTTIKSNDLDTMVVLTDRFAVVQDLAGVADRDDVQLLGPSYVWILCSQTLNPSMLAAIAYPANSPTDRLLRGAALFTNYDRFVYAADRNVSDPFMRAWRRQNRYAAMQVNQVQPQTDRGRPYYKAKPSFFRNMMPSEYASYVYDAVMAVGISACLALSSKDQPDHFHSLLQTNFTGASGVVGFARNANGVPEISRDVNTATYGIHNLQPVGTLSPDNLQRYSATLTHYYSHAYSTARENGQVRSGAWMSVPGRSFLFYDQTPQEPNLVTQPPPSASPEQPPPEQRGLANPSRSTAFVLVSVSCCSSLATGLWVVLQRRWWVVRSSQPVHLCLLCAAAVLVSFSVVFLSFDDGSGHSSSQLNGLCSAFPWFFVGGYLLMYYAAFSVLQRSSKLLPTRLRLFKKPDLRMTYFLVIAATVIVLLVFQLTNPLQWERDVIDTDPLVTFGQCQASRRKALPYTIVMGCFLVALTVLTALSAWKLKGAGDELSDARWIWFGSLAHAQIWAIGIPVMAAANKVSPEALYLTISILSFLIPMSWVGCVILPKIGVWIRGKYSKGSMGVAASPAYMEANAATMGAATLADVEGQTRGSSGKTYAELEQEVEGMRQVILGLHQQLNVFEDSSGSTMDALYSLHDDELVLVDGADYSTSRTGKRGKRLLDASPERKEEIDYGEEGDWRTDKLDAGIINMPLPPAGDDDEEAYIVEEPSNSSMSDPWTVEGTPRLESTAMIGKALDEDATSTESSMDSTQLRQEDQRYDAALTANAASLGHEPMDPAKNSAHQASSSTATTFRSSLSTIPESMLEMDEAMQGRRQAAQATSRASPIPPPGVSAHLTKDPKLDSLTAADVMRPVDPKLLARSRAPVDPARARRRFLRRPVDEANLIEL